MTIADTCWVSGSNGSCLSLQSARASEPYLRQTPYACALCGSGSLATALFRKPTPRRRCTATLARGRSGVLHPGRQCWLAVPPQKRRGEQAGEAGSPANFFKSLPIKGLGVNKINVQLKPCPKLCAC